MANYTAVTRTNHFHVTDEKAFREFFDRIESTENSLELWTYDEKDGSKTFSFGGYEAIIGVRKKGEPADEDYDYNYDYDDFLDELSGFLPNDEVCVIFEVGSEKLRYIEGCAVVVTRKARKFVGLFEEAEKCAAEITNNPKYELYMR